MYIHPGLYQEIITTLISEQLSTLPDKRYHIGRQELDAADAAQYLSQHIYNVLHNTLESLPQEKGLSEGIPLVNEIIQLITKRLSQTDGHHNLIDTSSELLTAVIDLSKQDNPNLKQYLEDITPATGLNSCTLFTGGSNSLSLESELLREMQSCDEICLLVSFIKTQGVELLYPALKAHTYAGKQLRILTSSYMQATDYKAIKRLASLPNTSIKISYNDANESLHAKTYIFKRNNGKHTCYIGSSNISHKALTHGLEWNLKVTQAQLPHIVAKVHQQFEGYWYDENFEEFLPGVDDDRLRQALGEVVSIPIDYSKLDLMRAKKYQEEILEKLLVAREIHGHKQNLIVAATGTGKTVISAFDFKRYLKEHPQAKLLFVAHRQEILRQALDTFRRVLHDENFGQEWHSDVAPPDDMRHLFASKDTLHRRLESEDWKPAPDYYDFIIVDEAHHAIAGTYQPLFTYFTPDILLGMTATPERRDGDITQYFCNQISAEIRLADALNNKLLSPFQYYGVTDSVDLTQIKWSGGKYDQQQLLEAYTANDRRTGIIFDALNNYISDPRDVRALCFCVNQAHAKYMHAKFTLCGLQSDYLVSGEGSHGHRQDVVRRLTNKEINYLFVVDIFNEGVDIPHIDTILFLRPTESLTVYLQQFGRGLRKVEGKSHVTVLDFVGQARNEFNYTDRIRAIIGRTTMSTEEEVKSNFPHLPLDCSIQFEKQAKEYILQNIKNAIRKYNKANLEKQLQSYKEHFTQELTLANFLELNNIPLVRFYKHLSWTKACQALDLHTGPTIDEGEYALLESFRKNVYQRWSVTDSYSYFTFLLSLARRHFKVSPGTLSEAEQRMCLMCYYDLYPTNDRPHFADAYAFCDYLSQYPAFCNECTAVLQLVQESTEMYEITPKEVYSEAFPLKIHGRYTRRQIQAAIGTSTWEKISTGREGVELNKPDELEALFVDLIKDRMVGSTTNYKDFAVSDTVFSWETQNKVSQASPTGLRYINGDFTTLLFVREQAKTEEDTSITQSYVYLGSVSIIDYEGNRPMSIRWKLEEAMPAGFWRFARGVR